MTPAPSAPAVFLVRVALFAALFPFSLIALIRRIKPVKPVSRARR